MTFRAFLAGCWKTHVEPVWEGDHLRCLSCGEEIKVLPQATVRGPAHQPGAVRGQPAIKAKKALPDNVTEWRRSQR